MLAEAYKLHSAGHASGMDKKHFPLLTIASPLGFWNAPPKDFILDTFDLSLIIGDTKTKLSAGESEPSAGDCIEWAMSVLPLAEDGRNRFRDFRLIDRTVFED
jgi:hypothetical protein